VAFVPFLVSVDTHDATQQGAFIMAGLSPIASTIGEVAGTVSTVANAAESVSDFGDNERRSERLRAQQDQALKQLKQRQKQEQQAARQEAQLEREQINTKQENAEEERRDALRRAVARQRAQFGASGISSDDGSAEAVLLGQFEESQENKQKREELDNLRKRALDQKLNQRRRKNVLERTQLAERQRLERSLVG
jgi:hypothetical protein